MVTSASVSDTQDGPRGVFGLFDRLRDILGTFVESRTAEVRAAWRQELRRMAVARVAALTTAFFICATTAFASFSILLAFWDTHRVLVAALISVGFAVLALVSTVMLRNATR
jgi:hypothetical protein